MSSLLITGGTGSWGRALIRHLLAGDAYERIVVFSRGEFAQEMMQDQLGPQPRLRYMLGDVRDPARLRRALLGVTDVVHTAALKYVAAGVYNVDEMFKTNIQGTAHVVDEAAAAGVARVLVIASDKGVHPVNAYGVSKQAAEHYAVQANAYTFPRGTRVSVLRAGNALWSRGSVAHRFAAHTGRWTPADPYRLTDRRMTRFGIRLSATSSLIARLLGVLRGGEVFVPRLPSFRVEDVAAAAWRHAHGSEWMGVLRAPGARKPAVMPRGYTREALATVVGLRGGGEKIHESLLAPEESPHAVWVEGLGCYVVEPPARSWDRPAWEGEPVPEGWELSSDKNHLWLSEQDLVATFAELDPGLPGA